MVSTVLIKLDKSTVSFLGDYITLIGGNNALSLGDVDAFEPVSVSLDQDVIELTERRQELSDNIHTAAKQLKVHYDQVAKDDHGFASFWKQEPTFKEATEAFPPLEKRRFFEDYNDFFVRIGIGDRLHISKALEYFRPFYELNGEEKTYADILKTEKDIIHLIEAVTDSHRGGKTVSTCLSAPILLAYGAVMTNITRIF